jgi:hypothetical protein
VRPLRITLIALLSWMAAPAFALRGVETGTQCARIPEIETSLGSKPLGSSEVQSTGASNFYFQGLSHERAAAISYTCEGGSVTSQTVDVRFEDEGEALVYFTDRHRELSEFFGPPYKDPDEPRIADIAESTGLPVRRFAMWVQGKRVVSLMLSPHDAKQWQVLISGP